MEIYKLLLASKLKKKTTKKQYVCIILRRLLYEKFAVWSALCLFRTLFCFIAAFRCFEGFPRIEDFALSQDFVVSRLSLFRDLFSIEGSTLIIKKDFPGWNIHYSIYFHSLVKFDIYKNRHHCVYNNIITNQCNLMVACQTF